MVLAAGVRHRDPASAVFEGMLAGSVGYRTTGTPSFMSASTKAIHERFVVEVVAETLAVRSSGVLIADARCRQEIAAIHRSALSLFHHGRVDFLVCKESGVIISCLKRLAAGGLAGLRR